MLKKITVEDRREMLIAELRKMEGDPGVGSVPTIRKDIEEHEMCALGVVCKLWPDDINWDGGCSDVCASAAALIGFGEEGRDVYRINDKCKTYPEVANKLEKLFAGLPVAE